MSYKYHGNWCGPGWSDGQWQNSVKGFAPAIDEFDETCRQHDFALSGGNSDYAADDTFVRSNLGKGTKRTVAALAVRARMLTTNYKNNKNINNKNSAFQKSTSDMVKNLRGQAPKSKNQPKQRNGNDSTRAAPVAIATKRTSSAPKIKTTAGGIVVSHRSFLAPVTNFLPFTANQTACNPGLSSSFPWLAKLARRFEQYRFTKLRYEFRSVVASSTSGVVMMSFDYDAADLAPATKAQQSQTVPSSETNVWMNNDLSVKTDSSWRYIRAGNLPQNLDIKTYDIGNMWLSSSYGNNSVGGELYVEYTVELRKPTDGIETGGRLTTSASVFAFPLQGSVVTSGAAYPFSKLNDSTLLVTAGGEYLVTVRTIGSTLGSPASTFTITSNGSSSISASLYTVIAASNTVRTSKVRVDTGDTMSFSAGAGTTLSGVEVYASPVDYDFV